MVGAGPFNCPVRRSYIVSVSCVRMDVEAWTSKIRMFLENIPDPVQVKPVQVLSGLFFLFETIFYL